MSDITQADVVVTQTNDDEDYSGQRYNRMWPSIAFGGGGITYPTYGVPLPDISQFRLKRNIKRFFIEQPANGFVYAYDRTVRAATPVGPYGTIRIYQGNGGAISGATFVGDAHAPTGNVAAPANHANIQVPAPANHSHSLVIAANTAGAVDQLIGANASNSKLVANANGPFTIPGNVAANGGIADGAVPAPANIANLTHNAPAFTGDSHTPTGNITGTVVVVGGALAELGHVAVIATVLNLEIIGA